MTVTNLSLQCGYELLPKLILEANVLIQIADDQARRSTRFKRLEHAAQLRQRLRAQTGYPERLSTQITYPLLPNPKKLKPMLHLDLVSKRNPTQHTHPATINFPFHSNQRINFQKARLPTAEINHHLAGDEHYPKRNNLAKISPPPAPPPNQ